MTKKVNLSYRSVLTFTFVILAFIWLTQTVFAQTTVSPADTLQGSGADDIDDMAIWVHPSDKTKSIVIGSDKYANKIFVWDLDGNLLQTITGVGQPGNIDLAYNFPVNGTNTDIVAVNERNTDLVLFYRVNPSTRNLERIDNGDIETSGENYGVCLYKSPASGKFYAFLNHYGNGIVEQFELSANSSGKITGTVVRDWDIGGQTEGCVADYENQVVYFAEEENALWRYGAEPTDSTSSRTEVLGKGDYGFSGDDAEGVTIYYKSDGTGYLILSDQGNNEFMVFDRNSNAYIDTFRISGVSDTDGIDVSNVNFGSKYPNGMFLAHNNSNSDALTVVNWQTIANALDLEIDTAWDPRGGFTPGPTISPTTPPVIPTPTGQPNPTNPPSGDEIPTEANLKVAFIGDSGYGSNFRSVLRLIESEGADLVLHQGDFDYSLRADDFFGVVNSELGSSFPYLGSVGNHDEDSWNSGCGDSDGCYADFFVDRMEAMNVTPDSTDLNDQMYTTTYKGLKMVFVGQDGVSAGNNTYAPYIQNQLQSDNHIWKICSWHKNQKALQVGGKSDEMGWNVYENCMDFGAIIATGHEHSYERTKTLTSFENQTVDSTCSDPNSLCVSEGRTFAFVSGLGGNSIRNQDRCQPDTYPYGCKGEWASIYTSDQNAEYGALFIEFNVDGDPYKAEGYFKNISGQVIDQFTVQKTSSGTGGVTPTNTPTNSPTNQPTNLPTPTATATGAPLPSGSSGSHLQTVTGISEGASLVSSGTLSPSNNSLLYIAAVSTRPSGQVESVNGLGLNWSRASYQCSGRNATGVDVWYAVGQSQGGSVTANLGSSRSSAVISVSVFNAATVTSVLGANTNGEGGACSGGTDSESYSVSFDASGTGIIYNAVAIRNKTHSAQGGFEEISEVSAGSGGDVAGLSASYANVTEANTYQLEGNISSATDWALVALEISGEGTNVTPNPSQSPLGEYIGDADLDGDVDEDDFVIWNNNRDQNVSGGQRDADFNRDGVVDGVDYVIWLHTYGSSVGPSSTPAPTPTATPQVTPTASPEPEDVVLKLSFSAQGITQGTIQHQLKTGVTLTEFEGDTVFQENVLFGLVDGRYEAEFVAAGIVPGTYNVYVKGPYHLRRKVENVVLVAGENEIIFAEQVLVGDFDEDNILDIQDVSAILSAYTALSVVPTQETKKYDVNWDGTINIIDISLVLANYTELNVYGD